MSKDGSQQIGSIRNEWLGCRVTDDHGLVFKDPTTDVDKSLTITCTESVDLDTYSILVVVYNIWHVYSTTLQ